MTIVFKFIDFVKGNKGLMGCKTNATKWGHFNPCCTISMSNDYSFLIFELEINFISRGWFEKITILLV